jgi:hypothetical protein
MCTEKFKSVVSKLMIHAQCYISRVESGGENKRREPEKCTSPSVQAVEASPRVQSAVQKFRQKKNRIMIQKNAELKALREEYFSLVKQSLESFPGRAVPLFMSKEFYMDKKPKEKKRTKACTVEERIQRKRDQDKISARIYRLKNKHQEVVNQEEIDFYVREIPQLKGTMKQI